MYYKNKENKPYFEPSQSIIERDGLVEITEEEFNQILVDMNTPTAEQLLEQQIAEAKAYLSSTDYKMTVDYFATLTKEEQDELIAKRAEARELVRDLEGGK